MQVGRRLREVDCLCLFALCELKSGVEQAGERLAVLSQDEGTNATADCVGCRCLFGVLPAFSQVGDDFCTPIDLIFHLGCQGASFA